MYKALYLSPMIPSFEIQETSHFFQRILGFSIMLDTPHYVILHKDNLTIHILNAGTDIGQMEFYLEVDDIDSLWKNMKDHVNGLKVRAPFNREYGMREIHIEIPKTNTLLFIGQIMQKE
jgi:hypothetical protein